mgnify:CR=1 FL=1
MAPSKRKTQAWEQPAWAVRTIKALQRKSGLNLTQLAKQTGIAREQLSRFKHRRRRLDWDQASTLLHVLKNVLKLKATKTKKT